MFPNPRNRRLPRECYCDPERVVYLTIRATEKTSPFTSVEIGKNSRPIVKFNYGLCVATLKCLEELRQKHECDILIACLMPDHLHALSRPRAVGRDVLTFFDQFKGKSTNSSWRFEWQGRLWQPRSFDHVLRTDESIDGKVEYIANNPVRKGYVEDWRDWPYTVRWDICRWC
jgi:REP element-mobilizing transposase RayT